MEDFNSKILKYCKFYNIPTDYLFEILEDQKVIPMIRGKATEYNAYLFLQKKLSKYIWSVQKLNLNAQTGTHDEDISITHRKSGIILKVEAKNAVRGSFSDGSRSRNLKVPFFKVKCHRSRSNISLASTSNDRYSVNDFDLIISNTSNAAYEGNTIENLEIIHNDKMIEVLSNHYHVDNIEDIIFACNDDWRFAIPTDIAVDNFVPRTPYVKLKDDENWFDINQLEERLLRVVEERRNDNSKTRRTY